MFKKYLVFFASFLIVATSTAAQQTFRIMGDPSVGSKFRPVEAESPIPFDKTYGELTDAQKQIFRANYGVLKETEKPPFPSKGLESIYKPLIKGHNQVARGGTLFLVAMVNEKGKVENVAVYESPADSITELANAVMFSTEFEPAVCDGTPCKMEFPFEFNMRNKEKNIKN
jgi:hypothetical protein